MSIAIHSPCELGGHNQRQPELDMLYSSALRSACVLKHRSIAHRQDAAIRAARYFSAWEISGGLERNDPTVDRIRAYPCKWPCCQADAYAPSGRAGPGPLAR